MKILVRAANWIGDSILSIPALEAVRARWPSAEIVALARPGVAGIYAGQPFVDRVIPLETGGGLKDFRAMETVANRLRAERFDSALLLPNSFSSAWLAWRAGIPERIGYSRDGRAILLTRKIRVPRTDEIPRHEAYYYLELLRRAGWCDAVPQITEALLRASVDALDEAENQLQAAGAPPDRPRLAIAAGAAYGSAKCWLPERFAEVADRLIDDFRASVILFGTSSEREITSRIALCMKQSSVNLAGLTDIALLPALMARCRLFVGNDSGAMHVAAAVGIPVVAIFGPTDPEGTAPLTERRTLLREPVFCSPCFLRTCPIDHRCMKRVQTNAVYDAARNWLERA
jgi:heptosyltransferase-2